MKPLNLQLFWYEKDQSLIDTKELTKLSAAQESEFNEWEKQRRKILSYELHQQTWVKVPNDGASSELQFNSNGGVTEIELFGDKSLSGAWKVVDGVLFISMINNDATIEYQVVANRAKNIHSGIQFINGAICSYSKFIITK
ncbi:hypothetical protein HC723_15885 [Vibrio sp. S11_S32]|uniref:hypothetical protein n=1 Tax=Vibrio sp. S11_S32 TaxID=2720225 RepID=UPI00167FE688|nr:hypothetical protein [Vibrio sp. S11_S32]MBD1577876.1 hypothetical protein [Vibrio sp. S11_S32]